MSNPKILVGDYMHSLTVWFSPDTTIETVVEVLLENRLAGAPVIDEQKHLLGFITEQDCLKQMLNDSYYLQEQIAVAAEMMRTNPVFISPEDDILDLTNRMVNDRRPKMYPVVEHGKVIGVITRRDVMRALFKHLRETRAKL